MNQNLNNHEKSGPQQLGLVDSVAVPASLPATAPVSCALQLWNCHDVYTLPIVMLTRFLLMLKSCLKIHRLLLMKELKCVCVVDVNKIFFIFDGVWL